MRLAAIPQLNVQAALSYYGPPDLRDWLIQHRDDVKYRYVLSHVQFDRGIIDLLSGVSTSDAYTIDVLGLEDTTVVSSTSTVSFEQAQSLAVPPSSSSGDDSHPRRRDPHRRGGGDDGPPDGQTDGGSGSGGASADTDDRENQQPPPTSRRRMGGAAGSRSTPSGAPGNSPEGRLDAAVEQIHAARARRLAEEPPHESASNDGKDW